jgi:hypothetical protein
LKGFAVGIREVWWREGGKRKCCGNVSMEKYTVREQLNSQRSRYPYTDQNKTPLHRQFVSDIVDTFEATHPGKVYSIIQKPAVVMSILP